MVLKRKREDRALKVLIIAPDRDLLNSLRELFTVCGREADVAHDGVMAIEKTRAGKFGAALVDESVPLVRAGDLIKELEASGVPAILMTKDPGAGGGKVLRYPFTTAELFAAVDAAAGKGEAKDE